MSKIKMSEMFRILLWKNFKVQCNQWIAIEIILPFLFIISLMIYRCLVAPVELTSIESSPIDLNKLDVSWPENDASEKLKTVLYTPSTDILQTIVESAVKPLGLSAEAANSETDLEHKAVVASYFAGIVFDPKLVSKETVDDIRTFKFTLRFPSILRHSTHTWKTDQIYVAQHFPKSFFFTDEGPPDYAKEGFLSLQNSLTQAFIKAKTKSNNLPDIQVQQMPIQKPSADEFLNVLPYLLILCFALGFMFPTVCIVRRFAAETTTTLKDAMLILNVPNGLQLSAWFLQSFLPMALIVLCLSAFMKIPLNHGAAILPKSSFFIIYIFFVLYICTIILFAFLVSNLFDNPGASQAYCVLVMISTCLIFVIFNDALESFSKVLKCFCSLIWNFSLGFGINIIVKYEKYGEVLGFRTLFEPPIGGNVSLGVIMITMILNCLISLLLCTYFELMDPLLIVKSEKWFFPFAKIIQLCRKGAMEPRARTTSLNLNSGETRRNNGYLIQFENVETIIKGKLILQNINFDVNEDDIYVLLGDNVSGKSTIVGLLAGRLKPTIGSIYVNGYNVATHLKEAREHIGLCSRHSILFEDLNLRDNLYFFSRLKGLNKDAAQLEASKYMKLFHPHLRDRVKFKQLSTALQRKSSLCCALCGGSKVILCDDLSYGLTFNARHHLFELITSEITDRAVLWTTHFTDEPDLIANQVAIIHQGEILCNGTPFFLKKKVGSGYKMVCERESSTIDNLLTDLVNKYIPQSSPATSNENEIEFYLPEEYSFRFSDLFEDLENNVEELGIVRYEVVLPTIQDIFMNIDSFRSPKRNTEYTEISEQQLESLSSISYFKDTPRDRRARASRYSFEAMMYKYYLISKRKWVLILSVFFLQPFFLCLLNFLALCNHNNDSTPPSLKMDTSSYKSPTLVLDDFNVPASGVKADTYFSYADLDKSFNVKIKYTNDLIFPSYTQLCLKKSKSVNHHVAATSMNGKITAWFNYELVHSAPLSVNLVNVAMYKSLSSDDKSNIIVVNHPLPMPSILNVKSMKSEVIPQLACSVTFVMSFLTAYFALQPTKECLTGMKRLQLVSGVTPMVYWLSTFIFDYAIFLLSTVLVVLIIGLYPGIPYDTVIEVVPIFIIIAVFGIAAIFFSYLFSFWFYKSNSGVFILTILNLFAGVAVAYIVFIIGNNFEKRNAAAIISWAFFWFPHFQLAVSLYKVSTATFEARACYESIDETKCTNCCEEFPYILYEIDQVRHELLTFTLTGLIIFIILVLVDSGLGRVIRSVFESIFTKVPTAQYHPFDVDVQRESDKVFTMAKTGLKRQKLVLDRVTKSYKKGIVLNRLSLCLKKRECLGLFGASGAGKTTLFKLMTGESTITFGTAFIGKIQLRAGFKKLHNKIGYCPQKDSLFTELTVKEVMRIFCLIRGIDKDHILQKSCHLARTYGFYKDFENFIGDCSRTTRRKISIAIACFGDAIIVFLDEPTEGIDPIERRNLWNTLQFRNTGKPIVFTTQCVKDCEAMSTRMAVLVNGSFRCLGTADYLKKRFSRWIVLQIRARRISKLDEDGIRIDLETLKHFEANNIRQIKTFVMQNFRAVRLLHSYKEVLIFHVETYSVTLHHVFARMEECLAEANIENYSVSQMSLEEIAQDFTKSQKYYEKYTV